MKKEQKTRTENFITSLELPKDVILKDADIHIMGNHEILIENHRGLLLFEPEKVIVMTEKVQLIITGRGLSATRFDSDLIHIYGILTGIEFRV